MKCAISSLPEPLAPVMNTDASVAATLRARAIASRNAGALPSTVMRSLLPCSASACSRTARVSRATMTVCAARPMRICKCVALNGLGR